LSPPGAPKGLAEELHLRKVDTAAGLMRDKYLSWMAETLAKFMVGGGPIYENLSHNRNAGQPRRGQQTGKTACGLWGNGGPFMAEANGTHHSRGRAYGTSCQRYAFHLVRLSHPGFDRLEHRHFL